MDDSVGPYVPGPCADPHYGIYQGDSRVLARAIPDKSIDLLFTDPLYDRMAQYRWLAELANRVLVPGGGLLCFCGIGMIEQTYRNLRRAGRPVTWMLPIYTPGRSTRGQDKMFSHWHCLLWAGGKPRSTFVDARLSNAAKLSGSFKWRKNIDVLKEYIVPFTPPNALVLDPFAGSGSIPAACKESGRRYVGFEIKAERVAMARQRIRTALIPLFNEETHAVHPLLFQLA